MKPTQYQLDFSLLPRLPNRRPWFNRLDVEDERKISQLSGTNQRFEGALFFAAKFHGEANEFRKLALLRAALYEFASVEDVLLMDLRTLGSVDSPLRIEHTKNPLFHMLKQLRNYNIHIGSSDVQCTEPRTLQFGTQSDFESGTALQYEVGEPVIDNLTLLEFGQLRESRRYSEEDKAAMVQWFNDSQQAWGVDFLIVLAVKLYCGDLIRAYRL